MATAINAEVDHLTKFEERLFFSKVPSLQTCGRSGVYNRGARRYDLLAACHQFALLVYAIEEKPSANWIPVEK